MILQVRMKTALIRIEVRKRNEFEFEWKSRFPWISNVAQTFVFGQKYSRACFSVGTWQVFASVVRFPRWRILGNGDQYAIFVQKITDFHNYSLRVWLVKVCLKPCLECWKKKTLEKYVSDTLGWAKIDGKKTRGLSGPLECHIIRKNRDWVSFK